MRIVIERARLDKEFPQCGSNMMLPFPDNYDPPSETAA
jgi:hypothetical protein